MAQHIIRMLLLLSVVLAAWAPMANAIACSPYVNPCYCGLCPNIVDCSKAIKAECYCGLKGVKPGIYPHPTDTSKFWMCSKGRGIQYGVEISCPYRLVFDSVQKACTVPDAVVVRKPANSTSVAAPKAPTKASNVVAERGPAPAPTKKPLLFHKL